MAYRKLLAMFSLMFLLSGCEIGGSADAGFSISWSLLDINGSALTCQLANASQVSVTVVDSESATHEYTSECSAGSFRTADWEIATGTGEVTVNLVSTGGLPLSTPQTFIHEFESGTLSNSFGPIVFEIADVLAPEQGTDTDSDTGTDTGTPTDSDAAAFTLTVSWQITLLNGALASCEDAGASFVEFELVDSAGLVFPLGPVPCESEGIIVEMFADSAAAGTAQLEGMLLNSKKETIETVSLGEIAIDATMTEVDLGSHAFVVEPLDINGNASLTWEWKLGDAYFTEADCEQFGIDYVALWIWNEKANEWWTEPELSELPCAAFDQTHGVLGNAVYSGFYAEDLVPAGQYEFSLGFYSRGDTAADPNAEDVLLLYDEAGVEEEKDGLMQADESLADGTNHYVTVFEVDQPNEFGSINVELLWENPETGESGACADVGVVDWSYSLSNVDWVASESEMGLGNPCQDTLVFDGLLMTDTAYELVVMGASQDETMWWYGICVELVPDATGAYTYQCEVLLDSGI